jgi:hypothetical protein
MDTSNDNGPLGTTTATIKEPLVYKTPAHQLADAYRRGLNRAKLEKMQRSQLRAMRLRRTALKVLAESKAEYVDPAAVARAHEVLDAPRHRSLRARQERKLNAALAKALAKLNEPRAAKRGPFHREILVPA